MADFALDAFDDADFSTNDLILLEGVDAWAQHLEIRLQMVLGEWLDDINAGFPYYERVWIKNPNLDELRGLYRQSILTTPGTAELQRLDLVFDAVQRPLRELLVDFTARYDGEETGRDFSMVFRPGVTPFTGENS